VADLSRWWLYRWWSRPCGGKDVLRLALPLVVSTMSYTLMVFIDRMFLAWHSTESVAAAMPAAMVQFSVICLPFGITAYVNTFVAQYHGAGQPQWIGAIVWQGVWLGAVSIPLLLATIPFADIPFRAAGHEPAIAALEGTCYHYLIFGSGAIIISGALSSFFSGRGQTLVIMAVDSSAALLNCGLDYLWIFGHGGFAQHGIAGASTATAVSEWYRVAVYMTLFLSRHNRITYLTLQAWRPDFKLLGRLFYFGGAGGLQWVLECGSFTVFLLLVGSLGKVDLAATTLAFNINSVAWVPMMGLGLAVSTLVGQQLGKNAPDMAARGTWTALVLALIYMGVMSLLYIGIPGLFLIGHSSHMNPGEFAVLRDRIVILLRYVALYVMFDAFGVVFVSAIRGAGDMRFVLLTTFFTSVVPLAAVWWGIKVQGWGLIWCWTVITIWVCSAGFIYFARFLQGGWRSKRVIEPEQIAIDVGR